jgi:hypothetical protein
MAATSPARPPGNHDRAGSKGKNPLGRAHGPAWVTSEALTACHPIRAAQIEAGMPGRFAWHPALLPAKITLPGSGSTMGPNQNREPG